MSVTAVPIRPVAKGSLLKLWIGLAILAVLAAAAAFAGTRGMAIKTTLSGLRYQVIEPGHGPNAAVDDVAVIRYEGRLADGTVFDSTEGKGPVPLPVMGSIPGFSEALQLMNKGARYRLWIPPALAYGSQPNGPIPANSQLEFDVTLVDKVPMSALRGPGGPGAPGGPGGGLPPGGI